LKNLQKEYEVFSRTYEIYLNKSLPYKNAFDKSYVKKKIWIQNILEEKYE
jgi:hypothetical protein